MTFSFVTMLNCSIRTKPRTVEPNNPLHQLFKLNGDQFTASDADPINQERRRPKFKEKTLLKGSNINLVVTRYTHGGDPLFFLRYRDISSNDGYASLHMAAGNDGYCIFTDKQGHEVEESLKIWERGIADGLITNNIHHPLFSIYEENGGCELTSEDTTAPSCALK